jgi:hypothetical protein
VNEIIDKIRVIMQAGVTWLTACVVLVTTISPTLPEDWQTIAANIVAGLVAAIAIIRRHTPVVPSARGILPVVHRKGL